MVRGSFVFGLCLEMLSGPIWVDVLVRGCVFLHRISLGHEIDISGRRLMFDFISLDMLAYHHWHGLTDSQLHHH